MSTKKIDLLIIDSQIDFCEPTGRLSVKGADEDMKRLAYFIKANKSKFNNIHVTLDSHHYLHIAHPIWWQSIDGKRPDAYTVISSKDVQGENPKWKASNSLFAKRSIEYVTKLEKVGKELRIWPPHCLIGSVGHAIYEPLQEALIEWEETFNIVNKVVKGMNILTEQYSVFKAEVPDTDDPDTFMNEEFIEKLDEADLILVAGEAKSHCVAESMRDALIKLDPKKFIILEDAMSSVTTCEKLGDDFFTEMKLKGVAFSTTKTLQI